MSSITLYSVNLSPPPLHVHTIPSTLTEYYAVLNWPTTAPSMSRKAMIWNPNQRNWITPCTDNVSPPLLSVQTTPCTLTEHVALNYPKNIVLVSINCPCNICMCECTSKQKNNVLVSIRYASLDKHLQSHWILSDSLRKRSQSVWIFIANASGMFYTKFSNEFNYSVQNLGAKSQIQPLGWNSLFSASRKPAIIINLWISKMWILIWNKVKKSGADPGGGGLGALFNFFLIFWALLRLAYYFFFFNIWLIFPLQVKTIFNLAPLGISLFY